MITCATKVLLWEVVKVSESFDCQKLFGKKAKHHFLAKVAKEAFRRTFNWLVPMSLKNFWCLLNRKNKMRTQLKICCVYKTVCVLTVDEATFCSFHLRKTYFNFLFEKKLHWKWWRLRAIMLCRRWWVEEAQSRPSESLFAAPWTTHIWFEGCPVESYRRALKVRHLQDFSCPQNLCIIETYVARSAVPRRILVISSVIVLWQCVMLGKWSSYQGRSLARSDTNVTLILHRCS